MQRLDDREHASARPISAQSGRRKRPLSTRKKILFSFVCLVAVLLAAEGLVRVRSWIRFGSAAAGFVDQLKVYDENLEMWGLQPNFRQDGSRISIRTNSLGFRGPEISRRKPEQTIRIACLGASTTFCAEVSRDEKTWPHRLQELLSDRFPGVSIEVINAGVPGYVAEESLKNLTHRVLPLEPDLLVVYHAHNDIVKDTRLLAADQGLTERTPEQQPPAIRCLTQYSLLADLAYKNLNSRSNASARKLRELPDDLPARFIGQVGRVHTVARERDIPVVLSTFLTHYRRAQSPEDQRSAAGPAFYYMPWMSMECLLGAVDQYNAALIEFAEAEGVPIIRETDSIPGDSTHFVDHIHLTDAGCERMAQRFADFLQEQQIVDRVIESRARRIAAARND